MDKPDAYKKGYVEFYKLRFKVTPDVLIPRPETELLVDAVLEFVHQPRTTNHKPLTILDLGTGSGNIVISIAKNILPNFPIKLIATDISEKALKIAKQNAKLHGVKDKITFQKSNLLDFFSAHKLSTINHTPIDIIVTNLPYIPSARIPYLDSSVKDFEPHVALDGGEDGFRLYRKLFKQIIEKKLKPKLIVGEIDYTHFQTATDESYKYFSSYEIEIKLDLYHRQRILLIRHK